jgi:hypothetical protein
MSPGANGGASVATVAGASTDMDYLIIIQYNQERLNRKLLKQVYAFKIRIYWVLGGFGLID